MAMAYRKKPVVVEAVQWTGENHAEMCEFIDPEAFEIIPRIGLVIHTLEGDHHASPGDYIIKGVNGEFYPCKPDIFAKTYESATLTPPNEALTLEQLREMKDKPAYLNFFDPLLESGWHIIKAVTEDKIIFRGWQTVYVPIDGMGIDYNLYRRPPEGRKENIDCETD